MIRPYTFDPNLQFSSTPIGQKDEPEWKHSMRYLASFGFALKYTSKACRLIGKIVELAPLNPTAVLVGAFVEGPLSRIHQIADLVISADALSDLNQRGELGLDLSSVEEISFFLGKGCNLVGRVATLTPLSAIADPLDGLAGSLSCISRIANLGISAGAISDLNQKGKLGLNLLSAEKIVVFAHKGIKLSTWISKIKTLGVSMGVITSLSSMRLALACMSPTISLIRHLREEGWNAFNEAKCYKTSYKLGMALLSVHLYVAAATLSAHLELVMLGASFALSYY